MAGIYLGNGSLATIEGLSRSQRSAVVYGRPVVVICRRRCSEGDHEVTDGNDNRGWRPESRRLPAARMMVAANRGPERVQEGRSYDSDADGDEG